MKGKGRGVASSHRFKNAYYSMRGVRISGFEGWETCRSKGDSGRIGGLASVAYRVL